MGIEEAGRSNKMFNLAQLAGWRESSSHGARFPPPHHAPTDPIQHGYSRDRLLTKVRPFKHWPKKLGKWRSTRQIILQLLNDILHTHAATIET